MKVLNAEWGILRVAFIIIILSVVMLGVVKTIVMASFLCTVKMQNWNYLQQKFRWHYLPLIKARPFSCLQKKLGISKTLQLISGGRHDTYHGNTVFLLDMYTFGNPASFDNAAMIKERKFLLHPFPTLTTRS